MESKEASHGFPVGFGLWGIRGTWNSGDMAVHVNAGKLL